MNRVTIAQHKDNWTISFGGTPAKRKTPLAVYHLLERRLMAKSSLRRGDKTSVLVKYRDGYHNETIPEIEPNYLLWAGCCFLEDYLPKEAIRRASQKYDRS